MDAAAPPPERPPAPPPAPASEARETPANCARITLLHPQPDAVLEVDQGGAGADDRWHAVAFRPAGDGRSADEHRLLAELPAPAGRWRFRVRHPGGRLGPFEAVGAARLWIQDGQVFGYRPAARPSPPQVLKIPAFRGSLPTRPLYVYLPRGYRQHRRRRYPVLFMHDGQNCFQAYAGDAFAGSWRADESASRLIASGAMRECIIVAVANGGEQRLAEYLPPYARLEPPVPRPETPSRDPVAKRATPAARRRAEPPPPAAPGVRGRADRTARYYRDEVAAFIHARYRTLRGREHIATLGSSMGGLFTTYLAWEFSDFARHHAALSPSYWATRRPDGELETVARLRRDAPRDLRLWLDSGTGRTGVPGGADDNRYVTENARDALLANDYRPGSDFHYELVQGATHSEDAWARRLPRVLAFLFPPEPAARPTDG